MPLSLIVDGHAFAVHSQSEIVYQLLADLVSNCWKGQRGGDKALDSWQQRLMLMTRAKSSHVTQSGLDGLVDHFRDLLRGLWK